MLPTLSITFGELMVKGGYVMWPLLGLSIVALTLLLERAWYFARTNGGSSLSRAHKITRLLQRGDRPAAKLEAEAGSSVYAAVARDLLADGEAVTAAKAVDAIESHRRELERFMPTLSTIITAAPMLGILGTVLGIIGAFEAMGDNQLLQAGVESRMTQIGAEIAKALFTTAAGLIIAIGTLFPYNALRAQVDRTLGRLESLVAAASEQTSE